jgi:hypothetical protein
MVRRVCPGPHTFTHSGRTASDVLEQKSAHPLRLRCTICDKPALSGCDLSHAQLLSVARGLRSLPSSTRVADGRADGQGQGRPHSCR